MDEHANHIWRTVLKIAKLLNFSDTEAEYFYLTSELERAIQPNLREMLSRRLEVLRLNAQQFDLTLDSFKLISEWEHTAVYVALDHPEASERSVIATSDPYLEWRLESEFRMLDVCFTDATLKAFPPADTDILSIYGTPTAQAALRVNKTIYIDQKIFDQMDVQNQTWLFVHETSH